jgi:hypothetical protein
MYYRVNTATLHISADQRHEGIETITDVPMESFKKLKVGKSAILEDSY